MRERKEHRDVAPVVGQQNNGADKKPNNALSRSLVLDQAQGYCDNPVTPEIEAAEKEVLRLTNEHRKKGGKWHGVEYPANEMPQLEMDSALTCAARSHSNYQAQDSETLSHASTTQGEEHVTDRTAKAGFRGVYVGENVSYGHTTPEEVVAGWMKSPGHCDNIMNSVYRKMGAGMSVGNYNNRGKTYQGVYWTQVFGA